MLAMEAMASSVPEVQVGTVDLAALLVTAAMEETVEKLHHLRALAEMEVTEVMEVLRAMEDWVVMVGMELATHLVAPAVMAV